MAIAQTATASQAFSQANPVTMAFDCNGGNLLVLGICTLTTPRTAGDITPTYNGVAMTDSGLGIIDSGNESIVELWYLVNPAAGSNTISVPNTNSRPITPITSAWSGVDTADPLDVVNSDSVSFGSNNPNVNVTTSAAGELIHDVMMAGQSDVPIANSHILISSIDQGGNTTNAQYTLLDGSSGITLEWTLAAQDDWAMIVASFNPSGAPPAGDIESIADVDWDANVGKVGGVSKGSIKKVGGVDA